MCDYSLAHFPNRLAVEGEQLVVHRFGARTLGLTPAKCELKELLLPTHFQRCVCHQARGCDCTISQRICSGAWVWVQSRKLRLLSRACKRSHIAMGCVLPTAGKSSCNSSRAASERM